MDDKKFEEQYTNGYNDGYLLSRFEPDLYKKISSVADTEAPYFQGLKAGNQALQRELLVQHMKHTREQNQQQKPRME
jgi:capsule polysaccharide export protein KpsE/RkpR